MSILSLVLFANFSSKQSMEAPEKPNINFTGTFIDAQGRKKNVENITIAGLYRQIPFYSIPTSTELDPTIDTTRIDLEEISEIRPAKTNPREAIRQFNNRDYMEVIIIFNDEQRDQENYIIETTRKIFCDIISQAGPLEKEISFEGIRKLIIEGFHDREKKSEQKHAGGSQKSAAQEALCGEVNDLLETLEDEAKHITAPQTKKKILDITGQLKETISNICG